MSELKATWPTSLAQYVGWQSVDSGDGFSRAQMTVQPEHIAPNGYLQAAVVVALADMTCAPFSMLPAGTSFTTIELKVNLLSTASAGDEVLCEATMQHGGRTTQVWDATLINQRTGKRMALFRCTQLILHPR